MNRSRLVFPLSLLVATLVAGCAVSTEQVAQEATKLTSVAVAAQQQSQVAAKRPEPLTRITGNYVGGQATAVSHSLALPPVAREVVLNFAGHGTLVDVARNVRAATGIPVRINPDVDDIGAGAREGHPPGPPGGPLPPGFRGSGRRIGELPLAFSGDLSDYLNQVTGMLGVSWEYASGEIHVFRRVTRVFNLTLSPGRLTVRDDVNTTGQSSGGSNAQQQQAGTFGSNSTASTNYEFSPWDSIEQVLKTMISPAGKFAINHGSGSIVVTDAKEHVDRIGEWVRQENAALNRQVAIEVREIAVSLRNNSQVGVDLNLVYQQLNRASGAQDWVFRFGAPSSLTDPGAGTIGFNVARPDSRLSGTNLAVQALNSLGNIVHDSSRTVITTNRVPARDQDVTDRAYLAETTPAAGGASAGTTGVPGLRPGVITYGDNLILVPTITDANSVLLQLFSTRSELLEINSVATGQGLTFQQINTPIVGRKKNSQNFHIAQGDTLVIVGNTSDRWSSRDNHSITGGSRTATQMRTISVLLVTPRVMAMAGV